MKISHANNSGNIMPVGFSSGLETGASDALSGLTLENPPRTIAVVYDNGTT